MSRRFIMTVLAAAVAFTGFTAAPARATDNDALLRTLGIGTTLLIVGAAIKNARDDDRDRKKEKSRYEERDRRPVYNNGWQDRGRNDDRRRHDDRGRGFARGPSPLPSSCLIQTRRGENVFGARCLQQRYDQSRRLPDNCRITMRTRYGNEAAYDARCLRRGGYDIARR